MSKEEWLIVIFAVSISVGMVWILINLSINGISKYLEWDNIRNFKKHLLTAMDTGDPTWEQVLTISSTYEVGPSVVLSILEKCLSEALLDPRNQPEDRIENIQFFIDSVKRDVPFDGLPSEVRVELGRVHSLISQNSDGDIPIDNGLGPLADQIKKLSHENTSKIRRVLFYNRLSLGVGVVGIVVGVGTFLLDHLYWK